MNTDNTQDEGQKGARVSSGEELAKRIRSALGPYNDDERPVDELVGVLVNHVHQANQYRQMVVLGGQAAQGALQTGDAQRAVDLLMAVTRPPQPQRQEGGGE